MTLETIFSVLIDWYRDVLGFTVTQFFDYSFHYYNLKTSSRIKISTRTAEEMGAHPTDRVNNTVLLQFEVDNLRGFFAYPEQKQATITGGPSFNEKDEFWFGSFSDPEGNPIGMVDEYRP